MNSGRLPKGAQPVSGFYSALWILTLHITCGIHWRRLPFAMPIFGRGLSDEEDSHH
jgi:hypothetical protein